MDIGFPLISPYFCHNIHNSPINQSYTFFNISLRIIIQDAPINSFTYIINLNTPFQSDMGFPIFHPFWQNSHNIHFQPINITNIHNPPNLSQKNIFD